MPAHLKFNPYIYDGYRPLASLTGCIKSLAYFHNETVNILTHGKYRVHFFCKQLKSKIGQRVDDIESLMHRVRLFFSCLRRRDDGPNGTTPKNHNEATSNATLFLTLGCVTSCLFFFVSFDRPSRPLHHLMVAHFDSMGASQSPHSAVHSPGRSP